MDTYIQQFKGGTKKKWLQIDSWAQGPLLINTDHEEHLRLVMIAYVSSLNLPSWRPNMCSLRVFLFFVFFLNLKV